MRVAYCFFSFFIQLAGRIFIFIFLPQVGGWYLSVSSFNFALVKLFIQYL
jgi:hypothetical protein